MISINKNLWNEKSNNTFAIDCCLNARIHAPNKKIEQAIS